MDLPLASCCHVLLSYLDHHDTALSVGSHNLISQSCQGRLPFSEPEVLRLERLLYHWRANVSQSNEEDRVSLTERQESLIVFSNHHVFPSDPEQISSISAVKEIRQSRQ